MEMKGTHLIPAPKETVWDALNDPDVLRECIPGCKELEKKSDTELSATVVAKVGPVKATFKGEVTLENLNPPNSYSIVGEGKGGIAGFAKGGADVVLTDAEGGTQLDYVKEGINRTLKFLNPNVTAACGCGESFSID